MFQGHRGKHLHKMVLQMQFPGIFAIREGEIVQPAGDDYFESTKITRINPIQNAGCGAMFL